MRKYDYVNVERVINEKRPVLSELRCDRCKKRIVRSASNAMYSSERYFTIASGHQDWGNDSIESMKVNEVCEKCVGDFVTDYLNSEKSSHTVWLKIEATRNMEG